jgi:phage shock protein PspC (stress-responsive transcriptional regulator)
MTDPSRRQRKLYMDPNDKKIAGVASGVAKYLNIDTTLVRAVWIVLALGGVGILLYVVLWIMLEDEPEDLESPPAEAVAGETTDDDETTVAETADGGDANPEAGAVSAG